MRRILRLKNISSTISSTTLQEIWSRALQILFGKKISLVSQKLQRTLNVPANTSPFSRKRDKPWLMANCRFHWNISSGSYLTPSAISVADKTSTLWIVNVDFS
ncbi:hypothetical protein CDAR_476931 [Caerostris darwini]|uniref:Uncharacterized protein n=1 Tax=Caerostris darwini TaxID=1538125 RepID=A0AAV4QK50_9ARAC|nr:hypothetical protein CDAR_476931 [Caerostris darwini]